MADALDPWKQSLDEIADEARRATQVAAETLHKHEGVKSQAASSLATFWLALLQAKATLEAAETQAKTARKLVHVTWWLAGFTAALAIAAVIALLVA